MPKYVYVVTDNIGSANRMVAIVDGKCDSNVVESFYNGEDEDDYVIKKIKTITITSETKVEKDQLRRRLETIEVEKLKITTQLEEWGE